MARPTLPPYIWTSNTGNRVTPTAGEQANGFAPFTLTLPLTVNGILGRLSDWVTYWANTAASYLDGDRVYMSGAGMPFVADNVGGGSMTFEHSPTSVIITSVGGNTKTARCQNAGVAQGGGVFRVDLQVSTNTGNTNMEVRIYDSLHTDAAPKYQTWLLTSAATGTQSLVFSAGSSPGFSSQFEPLQGPVNVSVELQPATVGGIIELDSVELQFTQV